MIGAQVFIFQTSGTTAAMTFPAEFPFSFFPGQLDRKNIPSVTYTETTLYGSLQPMEVKEEVSNIDYAIEKYRLITPPTPEAIAAKPTDRLVDAQGTTYRVFGAKVKPRANGTPHHVEILLETPSGLNAP